MSIENTEVNPTEAVAPAVAEVPVDEAVTTPAVEEPAALVVDDTPEEEKAAKETSHALDNAAATLQEDRIFKDHKPVEIYFPVTSSEQIVGGDELILPAHYDDASRKTLEKLPNIDMLDSPEARDWAQCIAEGAEYTAYNDMFISTLDNPESNFSNKVEHNNISLNAQSPKFKAAENQNLKGERAVIRLISHLGLGTLFQVPLWHTGIWVTFKPPAESEIIELNRLLIADKIKLGRATYGLVYSNVSAYTTDRLVDFAIAHVYDITVKSEDIAIADLKNHISCQDIHTLLWGLICTMYPRGFKDRRSCIADPEKCNFVIEETLNVMKLQVTNSNALTEWQKSFMTGRQPKSKDLASIKRYKEELKSIQKKKISLLKDTGREISITLKTPTISEYVEAGHRWIGDIVEVVDKALGTDPSDNERNNLITSHGQASAMRQYVHWIDSIEYDTNIIDDRETIEKTIGVLSADDEVRTKFIEAVIDYINASTVSIIAIPVFDCPNCHKTNEGQLKLPQYKNSIPLDVIQLFFGLHTQRVSRLMER